MKIPARLVLCAAMLSLAPLPLVAQSDGPSANGSFAFTAGGHPLTIDFNAREKVSGSPRGNITLSGTVLVPDQDVDGNGSAGGGSLVSVALQVDVDCLKVSGNTASISGVIRDANVPAYVGARALLAVVDNGEGKKAPALDQFVWGVYGTPELTWVPSDAELTFDPGVGLTWHATDFERDDDVGIPSHDFGGIDCRTFAFGSYSLEDLPHGSGNIQVKP